MSATTLADRATRPDPQPPSDAEDRTRWRTVGRGSGVPKARPLVGVEVLFNREQSDWLAAESARTGRDYVELVKRLVDAARTAAGA